MFPQKTASLPTSERQTGSSIDPDNVMMPFRTKKSEFVIFQDNLNHGTSLLYPYDYKRLGDMCLD